MKLIMNVGGTVSARILGDEVFPKIRPPQEDLVAAVQQRYNFLATGPVAPGSPLLFQNGRTTLEDGTVTSVIQIQMLSGGDVVTAQDTSTADQILDDLLSFEDERFGFNLTGAMKKRSYVSVLTVEFDTSVANVFLKLTELSKFVASTVTAPYFFKRMTFGLLDHDPGMPLQPALSPIDQIERAEFTIDWRLGSAPEQHRFYCTAPLRNEEHIKALEALEKLIL